ncbi:MAG: DUF1538 domain-containing protein [Candidatus Woesearchaeota archaeon]
MIEYLEGFEHALLEVSLALLPLVLFFIFFQIFYLKLPFQRIIIVAKGTLLAFMGLSLFLHGVKIGLLPVGQEMGSILGSIEHKWIIVLIGFLLGFVSTYAEPAVRVLNYQVEKVSGGSIKKSVMLYTISIGVGISVALAMIRILYGINLWYYLIPGYLIAFILMKYSTTRFVSIAFDSGGVATGPMTVTFVFALCVGLAASIEGRNPLIEGFGLIALVALAPILSVMILGLFYKDDDEKKNAGKTIKEKKKKPNTNGKRRKKKKKEKK